ncbi:MAG: hypothetical protein ACI9J3_001224 [Parvicellaceae bacterium]|jgi:hypothetical protein
MELDSQIAKGKLFGGLGLTLSIVTIIINVAVAVAVLEYHGKYVAIIPAISGLSGLPLSLIGRAVASKAGVSNGLAIAGFMVGLFAMSHAGVLMYFAFE